MADGDLIEYYGEECPHCKAMRPLIEKLESELGVKVVKKEVWHNEANANEMMKVGQNKCVGVPFLYNKRTGKYICGSATYERLKAWAA